MPTTLATYETAVRQLMQPLWSGLIPPAPLDSYINTARSQVAIDAECIRARLNVSAPTGIGIYTFYGSLAVGLPPGTLQPIAVRQAMIVGQNWPMRMSTWEWFWNYYSWQQTATGVPVMASQLGQGAFGSLYVHPTPDKDYELQLDAVLLPADLLPDNSVFDAIPYPWKDAVPFYAAWLGFQQVQRQADAQMMLGRYKELALRGRQASTPTVLPENYQGGAGAKLAAGRSTLTMSPPQPALGG